MSSTKTTMLICRACLNTGYEIKFHELYESGLKLLQYCIGIQLELTSQAFLCESCMELIQKYAEFKRKCLEANTCYRSMKIEVVEHEPMVEPKSEDEATFKEGSANEQHLESITANDESSSSITLMEPKNEPKIKPETEHEMTFPECFNDEKHQELIIANNSSLSENNIEKDNTQQDKHLIKCREKRKKNIVVQESKVFKCNCCFRIFDNSMTSHKKSCLRIKRFPNACGLCDFNDDDENNVKEHAKKHFNENKLNCSLCSYVGRDFADMVAHSYVHLIKEWNYYHYFCPCCDKKFVNATLLAFHFRSVHLNKYGGLCTYCDRAIPSYRRFQRHIKFHEVDGFICDHCNKKFLYRYELIIHLNKLAGVKPFICDTCGYACRRNDFLMAHIRKVHTKQKPAICAHCGRKYKSEHFLKKHLDSLNKERPFECNNCHLTFVKKEQIKSHMVSHQQRALECKFCRKKFARKSYLKIHEMLHMGLNPFKCSECSLDFKTIRERTVHRYTHGSRKWECPMCPNKVFIYRAKLKKHCKIVHNLEPKPNVVDEWVPIITEPDN